jgi:hypothetical protein
MTAADPLYPNGGRPTCRSGDGRPVYLAGRCGSCYADANVYHPAIHGVCGWPRPVVDLRDDEAVAAWRKDPTRGRCACGLEVRFAPTEDDQPVWVHFVAAGSPPVDLTRPTSGDADQRPRRLTAWVARPQQGTAAGRLMARASVDWPVGRSGAR